MLQPEGTFANACWSSTNTTMHVALSPSCRRSIPRGAKEHHYAGRITGYGQPEDQRRALEAGFDAHFIKPVTLEQLNETLARINTSVRPDPNRAPVPSAILSANRSQAQG